MDAFFVLADTAARSAASGDLAFSALPHAPVRPIVEPRRQVRAARRVARRVRGLVTGWGHTRVPRSARIGAWPG